MWGAIAALGVQTVGGIIGQVMAAKRRKAEDKLIAEQKAQLEGEYAKQLSTNFLDTAESQSAINRAEEQQKDLIEGMESNAVSAGSTPEALIAAKTGLNKSLGDVYSNLAAKGTARRDMITSNKIAADERMFGLELGQAKERTEAAVNFAANMSNVGAAGLSSVGMGTGATKSTGGIDHQEIQGLIGKKFEYKPISF